MNEFKNLKWEHISYGSGTQIVKSENHKLPHYYVYGGDGNRRARLCKELRNWLNNESEYPKWGSTLIRDGFTNCIGQDDIHIISVGPMILPPNDNGKLRWQTDPDKDIERAYLITMLTENKKPLDNKG